MTAALQLTDLHAYYGKSHILHGIDLTVDTSISSTVLKHRLRLLAGGAWELRDVRAA